jgi:RNA polymerase sigma-70 factor, ECF subfamily
VSDELRNLSRSTNDVDTSDRELVASAQGGDEAAFIALVERHRDQIYGFGLQITRSETRAAELAQKTFLFACRHLEEFRNEVEFGAWILGIAAELSWTQLHSVRPHGEELQWQHLNEPDSPTLYSATDWSHAAEEGAMNAELRRVIQDATERLPPGHRDVFLFKDLAGLSYEQIADISGDTVPAIKRRLHQARLSLHGAIDRFYSTGDPLCATACGSAS